MFGVIVTFKNTRSDDVLGSGRVTVVKVEGCRKKKSSAEEEGGGGIYRRD